MQWEQLTSTDLAKAATETGGICLIAMGVIERHSEHLPLGTDFLNGHKIACLAAEKEPAVVFPPFYFGQIYEARCFPGTITLKPSLTLELIQSIFEEIGRNGFHKIIVHNAHGGNWNLINFLSQAQLWEEKPYSVYVQRSWLTEERKKKWNSVLETDEHGHACECETSISLALHEGLVKMDRVPENPAKDMKRLEHIPNLFSGIKWYSRYPRHYAGDARKASKEKGEFLVDLMTESLAEFISAVKNDQVTEDLRKEFFSKCRHEK